MERIFGVGPLIFEARQNHESVLQLEYGEV